MIDMLIPGIDDPHKNLKRTLIFGLDHAERKDPQLKEGDNDGI